VVDVVVHPGDSLWTIAQRIAPGTDVRGLVDEIAAEHGTADLRAGETFKVTL
jgi:hypothetical protein